MPRPHQLRRVATEPSAKSFKPAGVRLREIETVTLGIDELEAIRWADLEGLYQEEAAARMGISRGTFARLVSRGRATVADALVNGKGLLIGEGPVAPPAESPKPAPCPVHGGRRRRGRRCRCHAEREGEDKIRRSPCLEQTEQGHEARDQEPAEASAVAKAAKRNRDSEWEGEENLAVEVVAAAGEGEEAEAKVPPSLGPGGESEASSRTETRSTTLGDNMIVAISSQGPDLSSALDPRFGRAHYFVIVERPSGNVHAVDNSENAAAPHGAGLGAVAALNSHNVDVLITGRVGPKAEQALQAAGIRVHTGASGSCNEALASLDA